MVTDYDAGQTFTIQVQFDWDGSPRRDFTVIVYSADGNDVTDENGETNMLHTDGNLPSEFDLYYDGTHPFHEEIVEEEGGSVLKVIVYVVIISAVAAAAYYFLMM